MSTLLYNPDRKSKEQLISEFVVRTQVYEEMMQDLETSKMEYPEQHYLLVGQRGAGKTTLLNRLKYGIQDSEQLQDKVIPVLFNEEQYNISELANLWENIAQFLEDYHGFTGVYEEIEKHIDKKNFEEVSYDILESHLQKHNKRLILLIDNIGDLLKKLEQTEVRRLREILQTKKEIRLIAGSPFYLETILDYHQPLFEFFKVVRLDSLNEKETESLLLKLGEINDEKDKIEKIINETPERIETLRTLTGGVPRTIALMYRIFTDYNDESTVKDLERILDAVTPLYKHRMDDLPIQQQKIVDAVAKSWDAISVKELKDKVRIDSKNISAQLRQLEKNQVIEKKETGTKNHLYFLKERFFNIWYLMRYGRRDDKQRVVWLVRFLESWCSSRDMTSRILNYVDKINSGKLDINTIELYGNVYAAFNNIDTEIKLLLKTSIPQEIATRVIVSDEELINSIKAYREAENWNKVLELASHANVVTYDLEIAVFVSIDAVISKTKDSTFLTNIIKKLEKNIEKHFNEDVKDILSSGEKIIIKYILYHNFLILSIKGDIDNLYEYFNNYLKMVDKNRLQGQSIDYIIITELLCLALAKEYFNLINKIFSEIEALPLKEIFRPIYYSYISLHEGKKSMEFAKAGPEIQNTISEILQKVERNKENLKIETIKT